MLRVWRTNYDATMLVSDEQSGRVGFVAGAELSCFRKRVTLMVMTLRWMRIFRMR